LKLSIQTTAFSRIMFSTARSRLIRIGSMKNLVKRAIAYSRVTSITTTAKSHCGGCCGGSSGRAPVLRTLQRLYACKRVATRRRSSTTDTRLAASRHEHRHGPHRNRKQSIKAALLKFVTLFAQDYSDDENHVLCRPTRYREYCVSFL